MRPHLISACLILVALAGCALQPRQPEYINSDTIAQLGPYTHAVAAGELVFVSGMIAHNKESGFAAADIESQTRQAFANLSSALAASGLNLSDVVKVTVYLKSPGDMKAMNALYKEFFPIDPPARTTVPGVDWGRDDIIIELDAIAVRGGDRKDQ